ncbi:MAG: hypothetical protein QF535_07445, partial [Anaerolineales bacterium]|nr:hypothetical protein [Anaerolineales bacterium]
VYKFESSASGAPPSDVEAVLDDQPTSHEASAERDLLARVRALGGRLGGGEKSDVAEPASGGRFAGMKALYNRLRGGDKPASSKDTTEALDSQVTTVHAGSVKRDEREAMDGFFGKEAPSLATPPPVRGKPPRKPDAKTVSIEKYPAQNNDRLTGPIIGVLTLGLVGSIAWYGLKDSRLRDVKSTKDNAVAKPDLAPHRVTVGVPDAMSTPVDARVQDAYVKDATVTKDYAIAKPDAKVKDAYVKDAHVPDVKIKDGSPVYVALHGAIKSKNRDDIAAVIRKHCGETLDILSADYNGKTPRAAMGELFDDLTYADTKLSGRNDLRRNFVDVMGNVTLPYSLTCD